MSNVNDMIPKPGQVWVFGELNREWRLTRFTYAWLGQPVNFEPTADPDFPTTKEHILTLGWITTEDNNYMTEEHQALWQPTFTHVCAICEASLYDLDYLCGDCRG